LLPPTFIEIRSLFVRSERNVDVGTDIGTDIETAGHSENIIASAARSLMEA